MDSCVNSYEWRFYNRKFSPNINVDVQVRPKSAKELGYTGRITSINTSKSDHSMDDLNTPQHCSKKRKLTDGLRVTIQQHCYYHHGSEENKDCILCQSTKHDVRTSRLVPVYDLHLLDGRKFNDVSKPLVIITPDTTSYRHLAMSHSRPNDNMLEIGCSTGECSALLLRRRLLLHLQNLRRIGHHDKSSEVLVDGKIVGFDTGAKILQQAEKRLRREYDEFSSTITEDTYSKLIQLHKVDALADPKGAYNLVTDNSACPEMVLIDIGGNRELEGVLRMIQWVQTAFKEKGPRLILVKSEALEKELLTSIRSSHSNNSDNSLPSITEEGIIRNGQDWFNSLLISHSYASPGTDQATECMSRQQLLSMYSHPKKAPLVLSPTGVPICRYHNYHPEGCIKFNKSKSSAADETKECLFEHDHCHWCLAAGHIALNCPKLK